ncbi:MAG: response regulator [Alphaproteobacteria bacterium]
MSVLHGGNHAQNSQSPNTGLPIAANCGCQIDILLVEDNYGDALMMLDALNASQVPYTLNRIDHGDDVLPYLEKAVHEKLPDIIFLDMELPGIDGFEILECLAASPAPIRSIPIVLVTIQSNFKYVKQTYDLPIQGYLTKSVNAESVKTILSTFCAAYQKKLSNETQEER